MDTAQWTIQIVIGFVMMLTAMVVMTVTQHWTEDRKKCKRIYVVFGTRYVCS